MHLKSTIAQDIKKEIDELIDDNRELHDTVIYLVSAIENHRLNTTMVTKTDRALWESVTEVIEFED